MQLMQEVKSATQLCPRPAQPFKKIRTACWAVLPALSQTRAEPQNCAKKIQRLDHLPKSMFGTRESHSCHECMDEFDVDMHQFRLLLTTRSLQRSVTEKAECARHTAPYHKQEPTSDCSFEGCPCAEGCATRESLASHCVKLHEELPEGGEQSRTVAERQGTLLFFSQLLARDATSFPKEKVGLVWKVIYLAELRWSWFTQHGMSQPPCRIGCPK